MLTLALLRHAKSSWDDPGQDDFDRPLNERGLKAAPCAGAALAQSGAKPTLVLCSSAARTRETLTLALANAALTPAPQVVFDDKLYLAAPVTLMELVRDLPPGQTSVLIVGHNPGLHFLAMTLAGNGPATALESLNVRFPTASLAVMRIDRSRWRDVRANDGKLQLFWTPKKGAA